MSTPYNDEYDIIEPDNLAFKNPQNILTQPKAEMITNEFISPVIYPSITQMQENKEAPTKAPAPAPSTGLDLSKIANSVLLLIQDKDPLIESIVKTDYDNNNIPRWVYILVFLIFVGLIIYLIYPLLKF